MDNPQLSRYSRIREAQPRVTHEYPALAPKLEALVRLSDDVYEEVRESLGAGTLFSLDLLMTSIANRAVEVVDAFAYSLDRWNVSVASTLVRLQIDNVLRAHLAAISPQPEVLLAHLAADKRMDQLEVPDQLLSYLTGQPKRARFTDRVLGGWCRIGHPGSNPEAAPAGAALNPQIAV